MTATLTPRIGPQNECAGLDESRRRLAGHLLLAGGFGFPASPGQRRLWAIDQITPGSAAYNMPIAFRLTGDLDVARLERALVLVARRHDVLRTRFAVIGDALLQLVDPADTVALTVTEPAGADAEAGLYGEIDREVLRPFDLSRGPLLRWHLFRLAATDHVLLCVMHHAIGDQASLDIVLGEVWEAYDAFCAGREPALPALPWQYGDYCDWKRAADGNGEGSLAFWIERLAGAPALSTFPSDMARPTVQTDRGASTSVELTTALYERLAVIARAQQATPFMVFLAALKTSLYLETHQNDLLVGIPVDGRDVAQARDLAGFFVNTVVIRTHPAGTMRFSELLAQVRDGVVDGIVHQDAPFDQIVDATVMRRDLGHSPLFQIMVNAFDQIEEPRLCEGGLHVAPYPVDLRAARFDLALNIVRTHSERWKVEIEYNVDLFDGSRIRRLLHDYCSLLGKIADEPGQCLDELAGPAVRRPAPAGPGRTDRHRGALTDRGAVVPPRDEIEARLKIIWEEALRIAPIGVTSDFFDLGGNSLTAIALVGKVRRIFGQPLPVSTLFVEPTIERMARELRAGVVASNSLAPLCVSGNLPPLFAAGSNHRFLELSRALGPDQPFYKLDIYRLQELRRDAGLEPLPSVEELAAAFIKDMLVVQPKGPYFIAGQCEGGIVALEIGRQLQRMGHEIALMLQFDTPVKGYFRKLNWLRRMLISIGRGEFGSKFRNSVRRHIPVNTPPEPEEFQHIDIRSTIWDGVYAYRPNAPYPGEVVLLRATETYGVYEDVATGWAEAASGFVLYDVPGDHLRFLSHSDSQRIIAGILRQAQERLRQEELSPTLRETGRHHQP